MDTNAFTILDSSVDGVSVDGLNAARKTFYVGARASNILSTCCRPCAYRKWSIWTFGSWARSECVSGGARTSRRCAGQCAASTNKRNVFVAIPGDWTVVTNKAVMTVGPDRIWTSAGCCDHTTNQGQCRQNYRKFRKWSFHYLNPLRPFTDLKRNVTQILNLKHKRCDFSWKWLIWSPFR